jgi:DNA-binding NarL/FixJ family response regulator
MSPQASWILQEEVCPRLRSAVPNSVLCVGAEDAQELVADGIAMAARMVDRLDKQGKLKKVTPGNIAYYTIQHLKSGRRAGGTSTVDIMAPATQLNGTTQLHSLHEVVSQNEAGDEIFELHDVISCDREDPSAKATRKLDWETFLAGLSEVETLVVEFICAGKTLRAASRSAGVSDSTMQTHRRRVANKLLEFMGISILRDIAVLPHWKVGLDCERELMACRADRRH